MLSRLPNSLAQLKAENNPEQLKNEIRQLLYSLIKTVFFDQYYLKMETIFMSTKNSKTNEPHRFRLTLANKLNLKGPIKIWYWLI